MRQLQLIRRGRSFAPQSLPAGTAGTAYTLAWMAYLVREDSRDAALRGLVLRDIVGDVAGHDFDNEITRCFDFAQGGITYRRDPIGLERVCDLWTAMQSGEGDCGVKSVALATCLALLGHRPQFVVITQKPESRSFSHVYVAVQSGDELQPLDPTPESKPLGYEPTFFSRAYFPIFT